MRNVSAVMKGEIVKIEYMREFIELASSLNFSRTAENLFLSQSALSRHIANMEADLGESIILRNTHDVELTPAGEIVLANCRQMVRIYDHMIDEVNQLASGVRGTVSLAFPYYASGPYLQPLIASMQRDYPDVRIDTRPTKSYLIEALVKEKRVDLGLSIRNPVVQALSPNMGFLRLGSQELEVFLSSQHPLSQAESLSLKDLANETFVLAANYEGYNRHIEHRLAERGISPKSFLYADTEEMVTSLILNRNVVALRVPFEGEGLFTNIIHKPLTDISISAEIGFVYLLENDNPALKLVLEKAAL